MAFILNDMVLDAKLPNFFLVEKEYSIILVYMFLFKLIILPIKPREARPVGRRFL